MAGEFPFEDQLRREIDAEVEAVRRRADEQGKALLADAERRRARQEEAARVRLEEDCDLRLTRAVARLDLEARNNLLRFRERELDQVFAEAAQRLAAMRQENPGDYGRRLQRVFATCRSVLPPGPVRVRAAAELPDLLAWLQGQAEVEVVAEAGLDGLVVESPDGRLHCDGTLGHLLRNLRRERAAELERTLFGEEL